MGVTTGIAWTDHTFNPWWGCAKLPGRGACDFCYAERMAIRFGLSVWGRTGRRRLFGDKHWHEPVVWDAAASKAGVKRRVFCMSMGDVFEYREDLDGPRERLWDLIEGTPNLEWLLLTKRMTQAETLLPDAWRRARRGWPENVRLGFTAEDQAAWEHGLADLGELLLDFSPPARSCFVSCEPLLGPIRPEPEDCEALGWVIAGGESGPNARPSHAEWFRGLREWCHWAGAAFFFKQWGEWLHGSQVPTSELKELGRAGYRAFVWEDESLSFRVGRERAGELLDGAAYRAFPSRSCS